MSEQQLQQENALLKSELEKLKKKQNKWIETDKKLLGRDRKARLVTYLDLEDEKFMKKYPNARIGDEIADSKPIFFALGTKRIPSIQEQHARIAAEIGRDLRDELEDGYPEDLLTDDDPDMQLMTMAEHQGVLYDSLPYAEDAEDSSVASPPADTEEPLSAPQNAGEGGSSVDLSEDDGQPL